MKIKLLIMLIFSFSVFGQFEYIKGDLLTIEDALTAATRATYKTVLDSSAANLARHQISTARHLKADGVTAAPVSSNCENKRAVILYANNIRTALISHFAQDSCHVNGADITTSILGALSYSATDQAVRDYVRSLMTSQATHYTRAHSTRYKYMGKIAAAALIAHAARDTSDASDVHFGPDVIWNASAALDTSSVDSTCAGWNRIASRFNGHQMRCLAEGDSIHHFRTNLDSIITVATNEEDLITLANEWKAKFNTHAARDSAGADSVHQKPNTNLITTASVSTDNGHIIADTATYTAQAGAGYFVGNLKRWSVEIIPTGSSTGASFYEYLSLDGSNWIYNDSIQVSTTPGKFQKADYLWPYYKVICNKRTDGTYKIYLKGE